MSHIHKVKHHYHHHKERVKHRYHHHKETVKHHYHHHKERVKHHIRRRKESLPQIIFNKHLVAIFLITLSIPVTIMLLATPKEIRKHASENEKPKVKGYIVEFNNNLPDDKSVKIENIKSRKEKREEIKKRHNEAKENVMAILHGKSTEISPTITEESDEKKIKAEYENALNGVALDITEEQAKKLKNESPFVKAVYPNLEIKETLMDSVSILSADKVWNLKDDSNENINGKNVNVAVIDTGVDYKHIDLGKSNDGQTFNLKVIGGYDFINNDSDPMDDRGHGTHVAGIIGGNGTLKGMAPGVNIIAYKVLDSGGGGSFASLISGIDAAIATYTDDDDPNNNIAIINISAGAYCGTTYSDGCGPDDILSKSVDKAASYGILTVVAAGNSGGLGQGTIYTPGTARSALTVGSISKTKQISTFSSQGPVTLPNGDIINKPDVVAPGEGLQDIATDDPRVGICSAKASVNSGLNCLDSDHVSLRGTSMAAPHVAGLAALVKQKYPFYNGSDIKYIITQNTTNLGFGINSQGKGMADASKIFSFNVTPVLSPVITVTPTSTPTRVPTKTPTPTAIITPTPVIQKITLTPGIDAFVRSSQPTLNFGSSANLENDSSPDEISFIRFNLSELTGKNIKSAKLILWISDPTSASLSLRKADDSLWSEGTITYNKKPAFTSTITSFNAKTVNTSVTLDVTSAVNSKKGTRITFGIKSLNNDSGAFYSRNSSDSTKIPRLVVEYN